MKTVPRWTAVTSEIILAAGAGNAIILLDQDQLTMGSTILERESKLVRLVGHVTTRVSGGGNAGTSVGIGILKTQNPSVTVGGINDPLVVAQMALRDWLRVMNHDVPVNGTASGFILRQEIDVKVQRRLKSPDYVLLVGVNVPGGDAVVITVDIRILIVIRM